MSGLKRSGAQNRKRKVAMVKEAKKSSALMESFLKQRRAEVKRGLAHEYSDIENNQQCAGHKTDDWQRENKNDHHDVEDTGAMQCVQENDGLEEYIEDIDVDVEDEVLSNEEQISDDEPNIGRLQSPRFWSSNWEDSGRWGRIFYTLPPGARYPRYATVRR